MRPYALYFLEGELLYQEMGSGFGCGGRYPCTSMLVYNTLYIASLDNMMLYKSSSQLDLGLQLVFRAASPL